MSNTRLRTAALVAIALSSPACFRLTDRSDASVQPDAGCPPGTEPDAGACIQTSPRQVSPLSLGEVTSTSPTFTWDLGSRFTGAVLELCSDRACTTIIETQRVTGSTARTAMNLAAYHVVFWRLRGITAGVESPVQSPTWLFHVPARTPTHMVDRSSRAHLDLNGDGFDDFVVGSPKANSVGVVEAGSITVVLGAMQVVAISSQVVFGTRTTDGFGHSIASAGDVNGDGFGDLIVGAPYADPGALPGRTDAGRVSLFLGTSDGILSETPYQILDGVTADDNFGFSVASAGDVNGDGYGDIVVGAPFADPGARMDAGSASVFYGSARGIVLAPARVLEGPAMSDNFGYSVASLGDANADGYGDIVVGAPLAEPMGRTGPGSVHIFNGDGVRGTPMTATVVIPGGSTGDQFGWSVANAGDLNSDGFSDLIVGARTANAMGVMGAGRVGIFRSDGASGISRTTRVSEEFFGAAMDDNFGSCVAGAGDLNGDGFGDFIIGAPLANPMGREDAGLVAVFHGSAGTSTRWGEFVGMAMGDQFGGAVAGIGDITRDGYSDIIVGAYTASLAPINLSGTASVYQGSMGGLGMMPVRFGGTAMLDEFGYSVASLGRGINKTRTNSHRFAQANPTRTRRYPFFMR